CFFFFQAEDGIRDRNVTGVQTCALPIWTAPFDVVLAPDRLLDPTRAAEGRALIDLVASYRDLGATVMNLRFAHRSLPHYLEQLRSEERRVGKECRSRRSPDVARKKKVER